MEKIINKIAQELNVKPTQVENAVKLIDEGNTIPFIARYLLWINNEPIAWLDFPLCYATEHETL